MTNAEEEYLAYGLLPCLGYLSLLATAEEWRRVRLYPSAPDTEPPDKQTG
jgi:hypothetical protein